MKGSASELKAVQSRSKVEFPAALGEKIPKERLSRSKQAFLIDSADTELFMYLRESSFNMTGGGGGVEDIETKSFKF